MTRRFGGITALDGVSLAVAPGEILGIIGRSGAAKSTLIRCLNGLERPDAGEVEILGRRLDGLPKREHRRMRGRIAGTSIGTTAIVPLSIAAIPYDARVAQASLRKVDRGLVEAVRAMGGGQFTVMREVLIPEALPGLVAGFTVKVVPLIGASAMAGAIGAGGLGDLAIRYGYQRFDTPVMVAVLVALVALIQAAGDAPARRVDHR